MTQSARTLIVLGTLLAAMVVGACGSRRPPVVTPPGPPICDGRNVHIYVFSDDSGTPPMQGVTIRAEGQDDRTTGPEGHAHFWACGPALYTLSAPNWHTANCGAPGAPCDLAGPQHNVHMTRIVPVPVPAHPDPVVGAIWSARNGCFGDDTGCRNFTILHYGDLVDKMRLSPELALRDMDRAAAEGYHIYRMWSHIRPGGWPTSGHPIASTGWDLESEDTYRALARVINEAARRGQRVTLETGGIDRRNTEQERSLMRRLNQAAHEAGPWKVAWFAPVNEPGSIHATSDDNGDNTPTHLKMLVDIARAGTQALWHLGGTDNEHWFCDGRNRFAQECYTHRDQTTGYYHGTRALRWFDKIRRPFTWYYEKPGEFIRKWIDGEQFGLPCSGPPLQYVSVVQNCHEVDAETIALSVAMKTFRGMSALMSGNGVRRYQEWNRVIGWREVPWIVRQIPRDVATYTWAHHSGDTHRDKRVLVAKDEIRIDGVKDANGKFAYLIYGPKSGATANLRIERSFDGTLCDAVSRTCQDVSGNAGGTFRVTFGKGRLFVGRTR